MLGEDGTPATVEQTKDTKLVYYEMTNNANINTQMYSVILIISSVLFFL